MTVLLDKPGHAPTRYLAHSPAELRRRRRDLLVLGLLVAVAAVSIAVYQLWAVPGDWDYTMGLRARQLGALVVVGAAVGVSSLVFQTLCGNRILTPGVMGFDTMYMFVQTLVIFVFGSATFVHLVPAARAGISTATMTGFGASLFIWLFRRHSKNLHVMVLVGIIASGLFGSLSVFASRLLSPTDYQTLQDVMFASFNTVDTPLLLVAAAITVGALAALMPMLRALDVAALGHDQAVLVGLDYHRTVKAALLLITAMVATSTALVGPTMFLGLIVANVARQLLPSAGHRMLVPTAALAGVVTCVAGQLIVARVFHLGTPLSVVVNLAGGIYFLWLVSRSVAM